MSPCIPFAGGVVTVGGQVYLLHTARGTIAFEWHDFLGPMPIDRRNGGGRELPANHPFWKTVTAWAQAGRKTEPGPKGTLSCVIRERVRALREGESDAEDPNAVRS